MYQGEARGTAVAAPRGLGAFPAAMPVYCPRIQSFAPRPVAGLSQTFAICLKATLLVELTLGSRLANQRSFVINCFDATGDPLFRIHIPPSGSLQIGFEPTPVRVAANVRVFGAGTGERAARS